MKVIHLKTIFLLLTVLGLMCACGGGETSANGVAGKTAALSVGPLQSGIFPIEGTDMDGVASIDLTVSYPGISPPYVTPGTLISGANLATTSPTRGVVKISIARATPFSGSGPIINLYFDSGPLNMVVTIDSAIMRDSHGDLI